VNPKGFSYNIKKKNTKQIPVGLSCNLKRITR